MQKLSPRPAMLNLRPNGQMWPKGSFCSAKCNLTTGKSRDTFCCAVNKIKKIKRFQKGNIGLSILPNLYIQSLHHLSEGPSPHSYALEFSILLVKGINVIALSLHTRIYLKCMDKFGCQAVNSKTFTLL